MVGGSYIDKFLSSGVIVIVSLLFYVVFSFGFYDRLPTIFWFVSAFFIFFQAEHIYNFIGRSRYKASKNLSGTYWQRLLACTLPAVIVAVTWWFASGL